MRLPFRLLCSLAFLTQSSGAPPRGPARFVCGLALSISELSRDCLIAESLPNGTLSSGFGIL